MGKITIVVESGTFSTTELENIVKGWLDEIAQGCGRDFDLQYRNCEVFVVPSDEG